MEIKMLGKEQLLKIRLWFQGKTLFVLIFAFATNILIHLKELLNPYVFYPDIEFNYVLYGLADSTVLTKDLFMSTIRQHPLFLLASGPLPRPFIPVQALLCRYISMTSILVWQSIVYGSIACLITYKIGVKYSDSKKALWLAGLFMLYSATMDTFYGGGVRAIGYIIVLSAYYCLLKNKNKALLWLIPVTYIFYIPLLPYILLLTGATVFLWSNSEERKPLRVRLAAMWACVAVGFIIVDWRVVLVVQNSYKWKTILGGESTGFYLFENYVMNMHEHSAVYAPCSYFLFFATVFLAMARWGQKVLTQTDAAFALPALVAFLGLILVNAGIAARQFVFIIPFLLLLSFWRAALLYGTKAKWLLGLPLAMLLFVFVFHYDATHDLEDFSKESIIIEELKNLPVDSLVAAHPLSADLIPLFTRQSAYVCHFWNNWAWSFQNFSAEFAPELQKRTERLLSVLYATSLADVQDFVEQEGVTHFLIEEHYYSSGYLTSPPSWDQKYKERILSKVPNLNIVTPFVLQELALSQGRAVGPGVYIVESEQILSKK
jgi:hypothetical protein